MEIDHIKVSVIVPIYNKEKFLYRCINSLIKQKLKEIEIILVNDGSLDKSHMICKKFQREYEDRIKYFYIENHGCSYARNYGIKKSQGQYIMFVDSDDFVEEDFCLKMYDNIHFQKSDLCSCGFKILYGYRDLEEIRLPIQAKNVDEFLLENEINGYVVNKIFRREVIENNNISFVEKSHMHEDMNFVFKYCCNIKKTTTVLEPLYCYYKNNESVTQRENGKKISGILESMNDIKEYIYSEKRKDCLLEIFNKIYMERGVRNCFTILIKIYLKDRDREKMKYYRDKITLNAHRNNLKVCSYYKLLIFLIEYFPDQIEEIIKLKRKLR